MDVIPGQLGRQKGAFESPVIGEFWRLNGGDRITNEEVMDWIWEKELCERRAQMTRYTLRYGRLLRNILEYNVRKKMKGKT